MINVAIIIHIIDIELDKEVFNSGFTFDSLQKLLKLFNTNNFFKAGHKVIIKTKGEMGKPNYQTTLMVLSKKYTVHLMLKNYLTK